MGRPAELNPHGLVEAGNIIFGMDGKNLDPDQYYYASTVKFTKTYRPHGAKQQTTPIAGPPLHCRCP